MLEPPYSLRHHRVKALGVGLSAAKLKALAYLTGVYLGDGCLTGNSFKLNTIDEDFALATQEAICTLTSRTPNIHKYIVKKSTNPNYAIAIAMPELLFLKEASERKQIIPPFVYEMPVEARREFIAGVMDSEGYAGKYGWVAYKDGRKYVGKQHYEQGIGKKYEGMHYHIGIKCTDGFILDFPKILESVGVRVGKLERCKPYKETYRVPLRFEFNKVSWLESRCYFKIQRKENKIQEYWEKVPYLESKNRVFNRSETIRSLESEMI